MGRLTQRGSFGHEGNPIGIEISAASKSIQRQPHCLVLYKARPTVPRRLRSHRPTLPPAASPALGPSLSPGDEPTIPALAGSHSVSSCSVSVKQRAVVSLQARSWCGSTFPRNTSCLIGALRPFRPCHGD